MKLMSVNLGTEDLPDLFRNILLVGSSFGAVLNVSCLVAVIVSFVSTVHIKLVVSLIISDMLVNVMTIVQQFYSYPIGWRHMLKSSGGFDSSLLRGTMNASAQNISIFFDIGNQTSMGIAYSDIGNQTSMDMGYSDIQYYFECNSYAMEDCITERVINNFNLQSFCNETIGGNCIPDLKNVNQK